MSTLTPWIETVSDVSWSSYSIINSLVFVMLSCRWLCLHHGTKESTIARYSVSSPSLMHQQFRTQERHPPASLSASHSGGSAWWYWIHWKSWKTWPSQVSPAGPDGRRQEWAVRWWRPQLWGGAGKQTQGDSDVAWLGRGWATISLSRVFTTSHRPVILWHWIDIALKCWGFCVR